MITESTIIAIACVVGGVLLMVVLYCCCRGEEALTNGPRPTTAQSVDETSSLVVGTVIAVDNVLRIVKSD